MRKTLGTSHLAVLLSQGVCVAAFATPGAKPLVSVPQPASRWNRESVRLAQTPQIFSSSAMLDTPNFCSFENVPTAEMTNGISPGMARLCAAMSGQTYHSYEKEDFNLNMEGIPKNEMLLFDDHGVVRQTTTPFMVTIVPSEKTLILAWQGSTTPNDLIHDLAFAPMASHRFRKFSDNLRVHIGFTAYAENDLVMFEDYITNLIMENDIEEIIFTGHSLGGGVATVAHFFVLYMLRDKTSTWAEKLGEKADTLVARAITFSAPPAIAFFEEDDELETTAKKDSAARKALTDFLAEVDELCCVVVHNQDLIPRLPGNIPFVQEAAKDFISRDVKEKTPWFFDFLPFVNVEEISQKEFDKFMKANTDEESDVLFQFLEIASRFRHYGNVIYYESPTSKPLLLKDFKPPEDEKLSDENPKYFCQLKYNKMNLKNEQFGDWFLRTHMMPVGGPGLAYQIPNKESKIHKPKNTKLDSKDVANWVPKVLGK